MLEKVLGLGLVAFYLNIVALFGNNLGEMAEVERGYEEKNEIRHAEKSWENVSIGLQNLAEAQTLSGALREAAESAGEALFYAGVQEANPISTAVCQRSEEDAARHGQLEQRADATASRHAFEPKGGIGFRFPKRPSLPTHDAAQEGSSRAYRAYALSLAGEPSAASREFAAADTLERKKHYENAALYSIRGIWWCRHLLRLGDTAAARRMTEANRVICESNGWNNDLARCDLLLGELDLEAGDRESATRPIGEAVRVFREARQGQDLPDALLAQARLRRSVEDCDETLRMARRSGFALKECEALNLRAWLRRELAAPEELKEAGMQAADDARQVLKIAETFGYYWGRHEGLRQLREAAKALGNRADEKHWDEAEKKLAAKMKPEIEEALRIEREHDAEMERLYGKKNRKKKKSE